MPDATSRARVLELVQRLDEAAREHRRQQHRDERGDERPSATRGGARRALAAIASVRGLGDEHAPVEVAAAAQTVAQ